MGIELCETTPGAGSGLRMEAMAGAPPLTGARLRTSSTARNTNEEDKFGILFPRRDQ
jgi:hypothetical protein